MSGRWASIGLKRTSFPDTPMLEPVCFHAKTKRIHVDRRPQTFAVESEITQAYPSEGQMAGMTAMR
ncbi:hypothetical protein GCM10010924_38550 [Rhizobium wenxiniae]|nr:hypothetical protein GCM10010924_38550 [Rhizobium wenxiniae]